MSGANVILKSGQVLFREGDASDGMYLVRKGEILVYLEKGDSEVKLAKVTAGAMIGEMALFDKKPRSASAKATTDTEVTKIGNDDFNKIMKQIPKWFVTLMVSLSTRLRETNERLQGIEIKVKGGAKPLENVIKVVGVLHLVWHKDGTKDAKDSKLWLLDREPAEVEISQTLGIERELVTNVISACIKAGLIQAKPNAYKKDVLNMANRSVIEKFLAFCHTFIKANPGRKSLSDSSMILLDMLREMAEESAYEAVTISFDEAVVEGDRRSLDSTNWKEDIKSFKNLGEGFSLTKVSDGVGFKIEKKSFPRLLSHYRVLHNLDKAGVS